MQHFIELGVDGLCIAMLGTLDNERHGPCGQGGTGVPLEGFRLKHIPKHRVENEHEEGNGTARVDAEPGEKMLHRFEWALVVIAPPACPSPPPPPAAQQVPAGSSS